MPQGAEIILCNGSNTRLSTVCMYTCTAPTLFPRWLLDVVLQESRDQLAADFLLKNSSVLFHMVASSH